MGFIEYMEKLSSNYYICSGETRCNCYVISSGVRIVSGKARFGSSESLGKSPAREFGESLEKPGSGVRIVSGKARFGSLDSLRKSLVREVRESWEKPDSGVRRVSGKVRLGSSDSLGERPALYICFRE